MGKQLYETTFVLHIAQEICLWSCSRHTSIHQDACWDFLWCSPGMFYWFCGELLVITIKYNFGITFVVANYILHIALAYFIISSRFGPDNCLEQVSHHPLCTADHQVALLRKTPVMPAMTTGLPLLYGAERLDQRVKEVLGPTHTSGKMEDQLSHPGGIWSCWRAAGDSLLLLARVQQCCWSWLLEFSPYPSCSFWHQQSFFQPSVAGAADQLLLYYGKSLRSHQWRQ